MMEESIAQKRCSRCGEWKSVSLFHKNTKSKDGLTCWCKGCVREYGRTYHVVYRASHKEEERICNAAYYASHKEEVAAMNRRYLEANREEINAKGRKRTRQRRLGVLSHYGGKCACCGETTFEFLAIDHINGGGGEHRRKIGKSETVKWLIKNNYPEGFQVLCHNCNLAKGFYGECPHQKLALNSTQVATCRHKEWNRI